MQGTHILYEKYPHRVRKLHSSSTTIFTNYLYLSESTTTPNTMSDNALATGTLTIDPSGNLSFSGKATADGTPVSFTGKYYGLAIPGTSNSNATIISQDGFSLEAIVGNHTFSVTIYLDQITIPLDNGLIFLASPGFPFPRILIGGEGTGSYGLSLDHK